MPPLASADDEAARRFVAEVVRPNEAKLGRLACAILGDSAWAEDVVADVFVAVWPKWSHGHIEIAEAYLYRATVHRAARYRRRRQLLGPLLRDTGAPSAEAQLLDRQVCLAALAALPTNERTLIALKYLDDRTDANIAELLGIPLGTVKSRVARGLGRLRVAMTEAEAR